MNYKIKIIIMLSIIFVISMFSGCIEDSRDTLEVNREYEMIDARFGDDNKQIQMTYVVNSTFDDIQVAFVEFDQPTSKYRATGVYIQDNKSYFKLIRKLPQRENNWKSPSIYHFEIHLTDEDLKKYIN